MRDILESHSVATLKKEISKTNIKGYSKMKKGDIVNLMLKHKERFGHIKMNQKAPKKQPAPKKLKFKIKEPEAQAKQPAPKKKLKFKIKGQDEKVSNFLADIEQKGASVASKIKKLTGKKIEISAAEKARTEAKAMNFLKDIEETGAKVRQEVRLGKNEVNTAAVVDKAEEALKKFSQLPPEIAEVIAGHLGADLLGYYNRLKGLKGFKINKFKEQLKKAQKLGKKGNRYYKFRGNDMDRLVVNINRDEKDPSPAYARIRKLLKDEIKILTPGDLKAREREKNKKPRDTTKVNVGNVYNLIDVNELNIDFGDYENNIWEGYAWSGEIPKSEAGQQRLAEKISTMTMTRLRKSVAEFLKQNARENDAFMRKQPNYKNTKFKTPEEAAEAYEKWGGYDNDMYAELDRQDE